MVGVSVFSEAWQYLGGNYVGKASFGGVNSSGGGEGKV